MKRLHWWAPLVAFLVAGNVGAQEKTITITVTAGKHDYKNTPVTVPLSLPEGDLAKVRQIGLVVSRTREQRPVTLTRSTHALQAC